jgi:hypothetical protein
MTKEESEFDRGVTAGQKSVANYLRMVLVDNLRDFGPSHVSAAFEAAIANIENGRVPK